MKWDIIGLGGLDWADVPGLIYFEVHRLNVHPVPWIKVFFENIFIFFEYVFPKFSARSVCFVEFFFCSNFGFLVDCINFILV